MTEAGIKRKRRTHAQIGSGLIPVTMRMSMQDRDHMERASRLRGSSLSEWLRDVVEDHRTSASLQQRLDQVEVHLCLMFEQHSSDRSEAAQNAQTN